MYALLRNDNKDKVIIYKKFQNSVSQKCQLFLAFLDCTHKELLNGFQFLYIFFNRVIESNSVISLLQAS